MDRFAVSRVVEAPRSERLVERLLSGNAGRVPGERFANEADGRRWAHRLNTIESARVDPWPV